ncbi:hypothetical protein [Methylobacterium nodulans]|uniref:Uncharacterized protein n=1 Tax=Methylobacterium nodulans (strain LMG 21967 / CNCM I-2342 / ORS 2060) TaxID=460265 RepID=B8IKQ3_METNO|nr:hypothetical protein [Methylobacterium nodulans]ACL56260.1 conserved hypothetical protein [Methylobacterium nodulans ORS 2060]
MRLFDARRFVLLVALAAAGPARAACTVPTPPPVSEKPVKPALPEKPACLDAKGGCPGFEAYTFNDAVKAYNAKLPAYRAGAEAYAGKLKAYVDASVAYANCEMKSLQ